MQASPNGNFGWRLHQPGHHVLIPVMGLRFFLPCPPSSASPFTGSDPYWGLKPVPTYSCFLSYVLHRVSPNKPLAIVVPSWLLLLGGLDLTYSWWQKSASTYYKLGMHTPRDSTIAFLHTYSIEMHTYCHQKTCTVVFRKALFIITHIWELPNYLSTVKWVNILWYIHMIEYYTAKRINNLWLLTTWISQT